MTAKDDLLRQLAKQKAQREATAPELLREWRASLHALFRQITTWLSEPVEQGLLRVEELPVTITEEVLGTYNAPSLKLLMPQDRAIHIVPKARRIAGALGRVDFECSPKTVTLLRHRSDLWQFATLAPERGGWALEDFAEEPFWRSLAYLIDYREQPHHA